MTIIYHIKCVGRRKANIPAKAKSGEELDRIIRDYYQLGGYVADLRIEPVVVLGTVGEPAKEDAR